MMWGVCVGRGGGEEKGDGTCALIKTCVTAAQHDWPLCHFQSCHQYVLGAEHEILHMYVAKRL